MSNDGAPPPISPPQGALVNATEAAKLLGISRRHFYNLKDQFDLKPAPAPFSTRARPMYRREDVLGLVGNAAPQGVGQIYDAPSGKFDPLAYAEADEELYWLEENERKIERAEAVSKHMRDSKT